MQLLYDGMRLLSTPFPGIGQTCCAAMISPCKPRSLKRVPAPKGRNHPRSTQGAKQMSKIDFSFFLSAFPLATQCRLQAD